jgi:hypothetical protein
MCWFGLVCERRNTVWFGLPRFQLSRSMLGLLQPVAAATAYFSRSTATGANSSSSSSVAWAGACSATAPRTADAGSTRRPGRREGCGAGDRGSESHSKTPVVVVAGRGTDRDTTHTSYGELLRLPVRAPASSEASPSSSS